MTRRIIPPPSPSDQTRIRRATLSALSCLGLGMILAGCAGPGSGLTGNDTGGIIPWRSVSRPVAQEMASAHCARYGKYPLATGVDARGGGYYSFSCRFDRRRIE